MKKNWSKVLEVLGFQIGCNGVGFNFKDQSKLVQKQNITK